MLFEDLFKNSENYEANLLGNISFLEINIKNQIYVLIKNLRNNSKLLFLLVKILNLNISLSRRTLYFKNKLTSKNFDINNININIMISVLILKTQICLFLKR
jgi:hypothetical protein